MINLSTRKCVCYEIEAADLHLWAKELERQAKIVSAVQADAAASHILDDDLLDIKFSLIQF